jgi:hypothetical protein
VAASIPIFGDFFTMGIDKIWGVDYDPFPPIKLAHAVALAAAQSAGKQLLLPRIGELISPNRWQFTPEQSLSRV